MTALLFLLQAPPSVCLASSNRYSTCSPSASSSLWRRSLVLAVRVCGKRKVIGLNEPLHYEMLFFFSSSGHLESAVTAQNSESKTVSY